MRNGNEVFKGREEGFSMSREIKEIISE